MDKTQNTHGTVYSYIKLGCKCGACKYAWSSYMREYRQRLDNPPGPYTVVASRDCKDVLSDISKIRREQELTRAIDQQNNSDTNRDSAVQISQVSMMDWATERQRFGLGKRDGLPGADVF